jgi:eukaryotic-like serine/threonine-protein kinase
VLRQRWDKPQDIEAFYQEGKIGQTLRHPNIVRIDEVAGHESVHYIAMEFVEGGNLRDFLQIRGGRLERGEAIRLMLEALDGLAYALGQGVTHRDLKLTNLLASSQGTIKLVDFGLATVHRDEVRAEEAHGQRTVEYALLEKTTGVEKGDPRSDIFFLGCVFYQMLTGVAPIPEKKDRASRLLRTRLDNIRPVIEVYPNVDRQLAPIVDRMMSLNVHARFQTPLDVIDTLRSIASLAPLTPATPGAKPAASKAITRSRAVLVMESDANLQATIREKLHAIGYRVILTADPHRGLERYREQPTDCVVVDCETTGKAGLDSLLETEEHAKNRKLLWNGIVILAADQSDWAQRVTESDNCVVMVKPVTMRQLRERIQRMVPITSS